MLRTSVRDIRSRRRGVMPGVAVAALATAVLGVAAPSPVAAEGRYERNEPAIAVVNPSTVFLLATWTGVVRERGSGAPIEAEPIVLRRLCSGVVINPAGYVVSTSLCVKPSPEVLLANALTVAGRARLARSELADGEVAAFVADHLKHTEFTGTGRRRLPTASVEGWLGGYREGNDEGGSVRASVVYAQPTTAGNVAVVKLARTGLPAVEIVRNGTLQEGQTVVLSGYGDGQAKHAYVLRNHTTTVGGLGGTNRLTVEGGIGPQAAGGGVVDTSGRLLALQDADVAAAGQPVRDLVKADHILRALDAAKAVGTIGDVDREYRAGLEDYFAGRFSQAAARFDALLAAEPDYRPARTYRDKAVARRDVDGDAVADAADWRTYGLSGGAGIAILVLLLWVERRRRPTAAGVVDRSAESIVVGSGGSVGNAGPAAAVEPARLPDPANADTVVLELDWAQVRQRV